MSGGGWTGGGGPPRPGKRAQAGIQSFENLLKIP